MIDVAPTVLEAAHLPQPTIVDGVLQRPIEGVSMTYSFNDAKAAERHETQYFEMFCNRGIYHKGWTAVTKHRTPWVPATAKLPSFDDDCWELYDTTKDWSQAHDLAKEQPDKLARASAPVAHRSDEVQRAAARRSWDRSASTRIRRVGRSS